MKNKSRTIAVSVLEQLTPLQDLPSDALQRLACEAQIEEYPARSLIFRKGSTDGWTRYLLSGSIALVEGDDGARELVGTGDAGVAAEPLGLQQPHAYTAISRTEVRLIRLPTASIERLLEESRPPQPLVEQLDEETADVGVRLFHRLFQDLQNGTLSLPSMPDVAMRVRQAVNEEDVSAAYLAKIIQIDPAVAARVIQVANSALYGSGQGVDSLIAAIQRLGSQKTREVVMAVTLREVFKTRSALLTKRMAQLWQHSSLVAATAAVLARKLFGFSPERALLAGLVHDIGIVPMLAHAEAYPQLAEDPASLEATIGTYRGQVGAMILRRWNFPEDLVTVALEAENWHRRHEGDGDYADIIIVVQLQIMAAQEGIPRVAEVPAAEALGLPLLGITDVAPVLDEAREEIAEVQRLLLG